MIWKRCLPAAAALAAGLVLSTPRARGEVVTPVLTQDQANRLSLLHDYGLSAIGTDNDVGMPNNIGNPNDVGVGPIGGVPGSGMLDSLLGPYASTNPAGPARMFDLTASPVIAYDSNPEARRIPRDSVFAGGELGAAYRFVDGEDDPIAGRPLRATFAYSLLGGAYEGQVEKADTLQQTVSASVRQTLFDNSIVLNSSVDDAYTMEHGESFLDTFDAGATGEFFFVPQVSVETGFNYTHFQYLFHAILPAQKPTSDRYTFVAKVHLYTLPQRRGETIDPAPDRLTELLRDGLRRFTINYNYVSNLPTEDNGHDYRYLSNRVGFGFEGITVPTRLGRGVTFDLDYDHEFQEYEFANTESPPILTGRPKGRFHRKDGIDVFTVRGNGRLVDLPHDAGTVGTYLQWDLIHDGSNIASRHYNEYVFGGGLTYRY
jgi:hypothetical protein